MSSDATTTTTAGRWLLVVGPDGTVMAAGGGAPSSWVGARAADLADAPPSVREAAARLAADVRDPARALAVEHVRIEGAGGAPAAFDVVALEAVAMRRADVDLTALLASAVEVMRRQAEALEIALTVESGSRLPPRVSVDPEKIAWAVVTLVGNALRHVRRGTRSRPGGSIRVEIAHDAARGLVTIVVRDDGPGIPADKLPWLFRRAPGAAHAAGLGLMLVHDVIAAHGGSVRVESTTAPPDHGTAVTLTLPSR